MDTIKVHHQYLSSQEKRPQYQSKEGTTVSLMEKFENSEFYTSVHPSDWFVRKPFCAKPINNARVLLPLITIYGSTIILFLDLTFYSSTYIPVSYRKYFVSQQHISTAKMHVLTTMTFYYLHYTMPWSTNGIMDRLPMSIIDVGKGTQLKMVRGVILPLSIDILFSFLE